MQNGPGVTKLTGGNNYTGTTTIKDGALQANSGTGLPTGSLLCLDGGVLQGNTAITFSRTLSNAAGDNNFYWGDNGGGFSAGAGSMTVNIGGSSGTLTWGSTQGSQIVGPLYLSSTTAVGVTTLKNRINLNGASRTICVEDNLSSTADFAVISGTISNSTGTGGIQKTGDGLLRLSGPNTYNGDTIISSGVLLATIGTGVPTGSCLVLDGGVFQPYTGTSFTRSMGASGATVAWTDAGGGFAANSSALSVNVNNNNGVLAWGASSSNIKGTLKLSSPQAANTVTLTNALDLAGGARTIDVADNTASTSDYAILSGSISDSVGGATLTKTGAGSLYVQGSMPNTYTGLTTVTNGKLYLYKSSGYAVPGNLTLESDDVAVSYAVVQGAGAQIHPSSIVTFVNNNSVNYSRFEVYGHNVTVGGIVGTGVIENTEAETGITNGTITVNSATDSAFNGYLRNNGGGSGTLRLVKTGNGVLTLSGPSISHTGGTVISGGRLILSDTYDAGFAATNITDNAALEFVASATAFTYSGAVSGTGSLTKSGGNVLYLGGSAANTYTGGTTVSAGGLALEKTSGYAIPGDLAISGSGSYVVVSGSTSQQMPATSKITMTGGSNQYFLLYGSTVTLGGLSGGTGAILGNTYGLVGPGNSKLTVNNSVNSTYSGAIIDNYAGSGILTFVKSGAGTLTLAGTNSYTGGTTISAGTLQLGDGSSGGSMAGAISVSAAGTLKFNRSAAETYTSKLSGTGTLVKSGSGALTMSGSNTFSGNVTVENGTLNYSANSILPGGNYVIAGGALNIGAISQPISSLQITGGSVLGASGTLVCSTGYDVQAGRITSVLAGSAGLTKTGPGAVMLYRTLYTGTTSVQAGSLTFAIAMPTGNYTISGGTLSTGAFTPTIGALQVSGGTIIGTGVLTSSTDYGIQGGRVDVALGGSSRALTKSGTGTAVLNGANTYTGLTTVEGGTLELGSAAQSCIFELGGADIQSGGIVFDYEGAGSPAAVISSLLTDSYDGGLWDVGQFRNSTVLSTGLTLGWKDDGLGSVTVMATYAGDFNLDGVVNPADMDIWTSNAGIGTDWAMGDANYDHVINLSDLDLWKAAVGLPQLDMGSFGDSGDTQVPEPGTLALLAVGLIGLLGYALRKQN